jgi:predicted HicB family RNase H-like nuclease
MMQYQGYTGKVEFDDEAEIFHTVRFTSLQRSRDRA